MDIKQLDEQILLSMSIGEWSQEISLLQYHNSPDLWDEVREKLGSIQTQDDIRYDYFQMYDAAQMLSRELEIDYEALSEIFAYFAEANLSYAHKIYTSLAFEGRQELLPDQCKAALEIEKMFSCEPTDWNGRLEHLANASKLWKEMGPSVKVYARLIGEEQEQMETQAKEAQSELEIMANQMKIQIRAMLDNAMKEQALGILKQLRTMLPEDKELIKLEREASS